MKFFELMFPNSHILNEGYNSKYDMAMSKNKILHAENEIGHDTNSSCTNISSWHLNPTTFVM